MTDSIVRIGPLEGTLTKPDRGAARRAVLLIAGSGPTDRDGNSPLGVRAASLALVARALASAGVASLRFDKRGIAASASGAPREDQMRFGTYVDDAVAWADLLRSETGASDLFILGHSEGALIGTMAAQRTDVAGLIVVAGAGERADAIILRQITQAGAPDAVIAQCRSILEVLRRDGRVADIPPMLAGLFRPSVQPYMASWLALDPAEEIARLDCPTLIIQGDRDIQVDLSDAGRLTAAARNGRLAVIPAMNHVLKEAPADRAGNLATYAADGLPLAPGFMDNVLTFIAPKG